MTGDTVDRPSLAAEIHRLAAEMEELIHRRTAELQDSAECFQALVNAAAQIVWTMDAQGTVQEDSPSCRAFTGQTYEQWKGWGWLEAIHPGDRERTAELWRRAIEDKIIFHTEYRIRHVNGLWRYTAVRAVPLLNADGSLRGWVGMNTDITERKQAEETFRRVVEGAPSAMIMVTTDGRISLVNTQAERLFGYRRDELLGQRIELLVPARFRQHHPGYRERFHADPQVRPMGAGRDLFGLRKDGSEFPVEIGLNPIETPQGLAILASIIDITERKQLEAERQKFVLLADSSAEFIGMCDRDFQPFYVNAAGMALVGLSNLAAACRVKVQDYFFSEDQGFITEQFFPQVVRDGHAEVEIRFRHFQTGRPIWMLYNVFNIRDAGGAILGWATVSRNIDDRKLAEAARRESEERLLLAQAVAHIGTFDWDLQTGVNIWTPELEAMYGLATGSFARTQPAWEELVHPDDRAAALQRVEQAFATKLPTKGEWRVVWPDGGVHWLAGRFQVFCDETGKPVRLMGVNIDITERKVAEEEIRRLNAELEQRVRDRTAQLEATVGELRQALAEIRTLRGLLPICAWCKKIRDDKDYWHSVEDFLTANTHARLSHGMCPECYERVLKEQASAG
jgi:PAS domain S-box-containing protein